MGEARAAFNRAEKALDVLASVSQEAEAAQVRAGSDMTARTVIASLIINNIT